MNELLCDTHTFSTNRIQTFHTLLVLLCVICCQGPDAERYVARERRGKFLGLLDRMRVSAAQGLASGT